MRERILLADSDIIMRQVYFRLLSAQGYEVVVAKDATEVRKALEAAMSDLILLDADLSQLSGWELLAIIRSQAHWEGIPVIMFSELVEPLSDAPEDLLGRGCYVMKRNTGNDLLLLIEEILDGSEEPTVQ